MGGHGSEVGVFFAVGGVELAGVGGLLDEMVEHVLDNQSEVGEKPIDSVSGRRTLEPAREPDEGVAEFSGDGTRAERVLVVAVEKAAE
jgi:hypothetical protein